MDGWRRQCCALQSQSRRPALLPLATSPIDTSIRRRDNKLHLVLQEHLLTAEGKFGECVTFVYLGRGESTAVKRYKGRNRQPEGSGKPLETKSGVWFISNAGQGSWSC